MIYLFIYLFMCYLFIFIYLFICWSHSDSVGCFRFAVSELQHLFIYLFIYLSRPISVSDLFTDLWLFIINRFQSYRLIDYLIFDLQPSGPGHLFPLHDSCSPRIRTRIVARWRFNINHLTIQPQFIYFSFFEIFKKIYLNLKGVFSTLL